MTTPSEVQSHIDQALHSLGTAEPPSGMEKRVHVRLQARRERFSLSMVQYVSAGALAAGVALSAVALNPAMRSLVFHAHPVAQSAPAASAPRVAVPSGFGSASAVHVPVQPVPVQPTPVNQGRGRSRSGRALLPNGTLAPLPRGVAAPHAPLLNIPAPAPDVVQP